MASIYLLSKVQNAATSEQRTWINASIVMNFPDRWRDIGNDCYLVATTKPMVTEDVSVLAGIKDGQAGTYIVTKMDPYYGWANKTIWEWVREMQAWNE